MELHLVWKILEIDETKDESVIKNAYHEKLAFVNPEDDQAGFMQLREAYEKAMNYARQAEAAPISDEYEALKDGSEIDQFIYRMNLIYEDLDRRVDEAEWKELLASYDDDLDGELQERALVYIMSHHLFPWAIWKLIDEKFHYLAETELLKEKFPANFLSYINYYITHDAFINFDIFEGDTTQKVDEYMNRYLDIKTRMDQMDETSDDQISQLRHDFELLEAYDVYHPYVDAEKLRFLLKCKKDSPLSEEALEIADRLASDYADDFYIGYYSGLVFLEFDKCEIAKTLFNDLLEIENDSYLAKLGMVKTMQKTGEYAEAKEHLLDILDSDDRSQELNDLLDEINNSLVPIYEEKRAESPEDTDNLIELGWCYFQQQKFEQVEALLLSAQPEQYKEYDYINLLGRNYLAMDQFEKAIDFLIRWRDAIDATLDDGSKDAKKKLNRKGFSHFAVGMCHWRLGQAELGEKEILDGIDFESNNQFQMSYYDQLAQFFLEDKQFQKAFDLCTDLIKKDEGFFPAFVRRQEAAFEMHRGQDVIDDFYNCKRIYPAFVKPYVYAMKVFYFARQYSDALNIYEQAKEQNLQSDEMQLFYFKAKRCTNEDPNELQALMVEFFAFKKTCLEKEHIKKDEEGSSDIENFDDLYIEDVLYRFRLNDERSAVEALKAGLDKYPESTGLLELKADYLWDRDKFDEAYQSYQKLYDLGMRSYNLLLMIGKYFNRLSQNSFDENAKKAMDFFEQAYELNPRGQENLYFLTRIYRRKFAFDTTDKDKDESYAQTFRYAKCLYEVEQSAFNAIELGLVHEMHFEYEKALELYIKAAELEPDNIYAHNNAGNVYYKLNRLDDAERELQISFKLENDKEPTMVYEYLVNVYEKKGEYENAIKYAKIQLNRLPKDKQLIVRMIGFFLKLKQYSEAIAWNEKLFVYDFIKRYEMCYINAKYYYWDGKKLKAMQSYHEALTLVKGDPEAKKKVIASKEEWKNQ